MTSSNGVVQCNFNGRLGNKLFVYFVARIFAEKNNLNLISNIDNDYFDIKKNKYFGPEPNELKKFVLNDNSYNKSINTIEFMGKGFYIFSGFFQFENYLYENRDLLLSFIDIDIDIDIKLNKSTDIQDKKNITTLHVRLDDYLNESRHLVVNINYYVDCLQKYCKNVEEIYIICDKLRKPWEKKYMDKLTSKIQKLDKKVIFKERSIKDDIYMIINSDIIITYNSTYCY